VFLLDLIIHSVCTFSEGLARIRLYGRYGFIDPTGKEVIPLKYDLPGSFFGDLASVRLNGKVFYFDKAGNRIG
jgi:hypothetical protein